MDSIMGLFSSAALGGITGLLGIVAGRFADYFTMKQKNAHNLSMRDKDLEVAKVEAEKELSIARDTNNANREIAEAELQEKSYEGDRATYMTPETMKGCPGWAKGMVAFLFAIVDFIRGLTRPGITLYLCVLTTLMYMQMKSIVTASGKQAFTPEDAVKIIWLIVDAVIYLTTVCVTWWFGTRPKQTR